jgi:hypothetical protein
LRAENGNAWQCEDNQPTKDSTCALERQRHNVFSVKRVHKDEIKEGAPCIAIMMQPFHRVCVVYFQPLPATDSLGSSHNFPLEALLATYKLLCAFLLQWQAMVETITG